MNTCHCIGNKECSICYDALCKAFDKAYESLKSIGMEDCLEAKEFMWDFYKQRDLDNMDLSITEIEGPAEFYDWEAEEAIVNHMYDWKVDWRALQEQEEADKYGHLQEAADAYYEELDRLEEIVESGPYDPMASLQLELKVAEMFGCECDKSYAYEGIGILSEENADNNFGDGDPSEWTY
jgi:hypothetical protein